MKHPVIIFNATRARERAKALMRWFEKTISQPEDLMHAKTNDPIQSRVTVAVDCDLYRFFSHWLGLRVSWPEPVLDFFGITILTLFRRGFFGHSVF